MTVQPVTIQQDQDILLCGGIDPTHTQVDIAPLQRKDTRHIGGQYLLKRTGSNGLNHLFGDQGHRYGSLIQGLSLLGSSHQGMFLHPVGPDQIGKTDRIVETDGVVGIHFQQQAHISIDTIRIILGQVTECQ